MPDIARLHQHYYEAFHLLILHYIYRTAATPLSILYHAITGGVSILSLWYYAIFISAFIFWPPAFTIASPRRLPLGAPCSQQSSPLKLAIIYLHFFRFFWYFYIFCRFFFSFIAESRYFYNIFIISQFRRTAARHHSRIAAVSIDDHFWGYFHTLLSSSSTRRRFSELYDYILINAARCWNIFSAAKPVSRDSFSLSLWYFICCFLSYYI